MLFLPSQTTKYCAHWWCHSQKSLATCYDKQVLVPVYCSMQPNPFNIYIYIYFFSPLLFFQLISLSLPLLPSDLLSLSLIPLCPSSPTQAPSCRCPSLLSLCCDWVFFVCFHMGLVVVVVVVDFGYGSGGGSEFLTKPHKKPMQKKEGIQMLY